jgi:hypothetical protein
LNSLVLLWENDSERCALLLVSSIEPRSYLAEILCLAESHLGALKRYELIGASDRFLALYTLVSGLRPTDTKLRRSERQVAVVLDYGRRE